MYLLQAQPLFILKIITIYMLTAIDVLHQLPTQLHFLTVLAVLRYQSLAGSLKVGSCSKIVITTWSTFSHQEHEEHQDRQDLFKCPQ